MMNQDLLQLLTSASYKNEKGSILRFIGARITKNEEDIGSFRVESDGNEDFLLITNEEVGTVAFVVIVETGEGVSPTIRLYRKKGDENCILLTAIEGES